MENLKTCASCGQQYDYIDEPAEVKQGGDSICPTCWNEKKSEPMDIEDIQSAHEESGGHFFDPDTIKFFNSIIYPDVSEHNGEAYFITSEQFEDEPRKYTIRIFNPETARIRTSGQFNNIPSLELAEEYITRLISES